MDNTTHALYLQLITRGLAIAINFDGEVMGYHVVNGQARDTGHPLDILAWHLGHAYPAAQVSPWALVSVSNVLAQMLEPV